MYHPNGRYKPLDPQLSTAFLQSLKACSATLASTKETLFPRTRTPVTSRKLIYFPNPPIRLR